MGGRSSRRAAASKLQKDSPWTLEVGVDHRPHPDPFSHSGLQPIVVPGYQVKMKSMFNEESRAEEKYQGGLRGGPTLAELGRLVLQEPSSVSRSRPSRVKVT